MKRPSSLERCFIGMGLLVAVAGAWLVVFPRELNLPLPGGRSNDHPYLMHTSKSGCRLLGLVELGIGTGLCYIAVFPLKR